MLSKSAARTFFLVGTAACGLAFVLLTLDTFQQIPTQTGEANLTESAIRGKHLFDQSNCMGCHTILGEGAYYAPELTRVYERRGPEFIAAMLRDPESMYPGQRRMQQYDFTEEEITDLVAFLEWVNGMDLNGFPPTPPLASAAGTTAEATVADGRPPVFNQMCVACHAVGGRGGSVGPALDGVASRFDREYFTRWLADPGSVRPGTTMPKLPLSDEHIGQLSDYLATLQN
ncbi:MAG: c-type cytochrome [Sandaracinus sp.]|nr:c-type cytochrome [Sandaracinus sp.]MCB9622976.1 c-type cytochrome [Sandaracinus sp.]MCB9635300.1 c-type cytochrome [Sandaracinus sp.]